MRSPARTAAAGIAFAAAILLAACTAFEAPMSKQVRERNSFRIVHDDGRNTIWSARTLEASESAAWSLLLVDERKRVEDFFATSVPGRITLWLVNELPAQFPGDAFSERSDIYLRIGRLRGPGATDECLLAHEMAHVVMHQAFGMRRPFWFEEGTATYVEGSRQGFGAEGRDMLGGVDLEGVDPQALSLAGLDRLDRPVAYRLAAAAIELIIEQHGMSAIRRLLREPEGRGFTDGYFRVTGESLDRLESRWRDEIRAAVNLQAHPR